MFDLQDHAITSACGEPTVRTQRPGQGGHEEAVLESASLLMGSREVLIRHGGETYRLRHTRNDKLILTK